ncbi:hypothetical protein ARMGADRAFT_1079104 [Armillaria gallica]|uniref:Uncharacterized protein n=1 Tax=Armillaria gallica TaxID=47427 RepID=A0A2H3E419_ARMGA|nr:hypothetical protein ARMGADRAFT_1079104 [Armillaria gallica]
MSCLDIQYSILNYQVPDVDIRLRVEGSLSKRWSDKMAARKAVEVASTDDSDQEGDKKPEVFNNGATDSGPDSGVVGSLQRTGPFALAVTSSVSWLEDEGRHSAAAIRESKVLEC